MRYCTDASEVGAYGTSCSHKADVVGIQRSFGETDRPLSIDNVGEQGA
jgi:hypothetical protein